MAILKRYVRNRANPEGCMIPIRRKSSGHAPITSMVRNSLVYLHPYMRAGCVGEGGWEGKHGTTKDIMYSRKYTPVYSNNSKLSHHTQQSTSMSFAWRMKTSKRSGS